jgi:2-polyprenyl-6-methoxyphenol hydroxylase-like FAD-dependent oxidoreductase
MIFGRRAFFGYTVSPSGEVWWFANPPSLRELTRDELAATTGTGWRQQLIELFADDAGPAAEIIWSTSGELIGFNQHDMPSVPTWHRGRMIVIGDAAHATAPSSGQGASMAIEDAVTLALCLRDWDGTESAFARYESLRRERVERVVAFGKRSGSYKVPGPLGRVVRDLVLPVFLRHAARPESQAWLYQHHIEWDTHTGREPKLRDASIAGSR